MKRILWILVHATLFTVLASWGPLRAFDRPMSDFQLSALRRLRMRGPPPVACVLVDQDALRKLTAPAFRPYLARIVARISRQHPLAIALDVLLLSPGDPIADRQLAAALAQQPAVIAAALDTRSGRWLLPDPMFRAVAAPAHVVIQPDGDGILRRLSAYKQSEGLSLPSLPLAAAQIAKPGLSFPIGAAIVPDFAFGPQDIPTVRSESLLAGGNDTIFGHRVVFVGISAPGANDPVYLPTRRGEGPVPGVVAVASIAASLLTGGWLHRSPPILLFGIFLVVPLLILRWRRSRGRFRAGHIVLIAVTVEAIALLSAFGRVELPAASMMLSATATVLAVEIAEAKAIERRTERLLTDLVSEAPPVNAARRGDSMRRLELLQHLQARIKQDRDQRRMLLDGLDEGVVLCDREGNVLMSNAAAGKLLGTGGQFLTASGPRYEILRTATSNGPIRVGNRDLEIQMRPLDDGHRAALIRDVTLVKELERRRREIERMITHELRTPLTSLAGFGHMLQRYELDRDERQRVATLICSEAERLAHMVGTVLEIENLNGHEGGRALDVVCLRELIRSRCDVLQAAAESRRQSLTADLDDVDPIRANAGLLERAIDNLVGNAIKHGRDGTAITVRLRQRGTLVTIEVIDDGPGIDPEDLPHIFERFYRGRHAAADGAGLGLAFVRKAVEWHGGSVEVNSDPGAGTAFRLQLPMISKEEPGA